jgi:TolA-binding protein
MAGHLKTRNRVNAAILVAAFACARLASAADAEQPADRYAAAVEQFRNGQYADVVDALRTALKEQADDPRAAAARIYLAEALLHSNRPAEAAVEYRRYLKSDVADEARATAEFRLAEALFLAADWQAAVEAAATFVDDHPTHSAAPRARHYLGEAAYSAGDYALAEKTLARFIADHPDDPQTERAALVRAACLLQLGRAAEAWKILAPRLDEKADRRNPLVEQLAGAAIIVRADEAAADGRLDEAEAEYDRLLKTLPRHERAPYAAFRRAQLAIERGDWPVAAERFSAAARRGDLGDELTPLARLGQAQALAQDHQWDELLDVAAAAKRQHARWPRVYEFDYLRGRAYIAKAELNEARTAFALVLAAKAAAGTETAVLARFMTAETYFLQQSYEPALAEYEQVAACDLAPWQAAAQRQCDRCRERLGRAAATTNLQRK